MCLCICIYKILVCNFCLSVWHLIGTCSSTLSRGKSIFIRFLAYSRVFAMFSCVISDELTFIIVFLWHTLLSLCLSYFSFTLQIACDTLRLSCYPPSLSLSYSQFPVHRAALFRVTLSISVSRIEFPVLFSHFSTFVARARNFKLV